jgi:hypothetical protein
MGTYSILFDSIFDHIYFIFGLWAAVWEYKKQGIIIIIIIILIIYWLKLFVAITF